MRILFLFAAIQSKNVDEETFQSLINTDFVREINFMYPLENFKIFCIKGNLSFSKTNWLKY